jgi:hypothetical protein
MRGSIAMALAFIGSLVVPLDAQNVTVGRSGDLVTVQAPGLGFIKGEALARLKDGRSVRVDLDLTVLPGPGGAPAARGRQAYVVSYDLWEERFAVTLAGPPPRSVAYLTASAAEAWCMEQLTIPVSAFGALRAAPFWIRLEYRILDGDRAGTGDDGSGLSLKSMIEALSRRPKTTSLTHAIEAGPFRLRS